MERGLERFSMKKRYELSDGKGKLIEAIERDLTQAEINKNILNEIKILEAQQTPRRIREAATWNRDSINFLKDIDRQITALRNQLKGD